MVAYHVPLGLDPTDEVRVLLRVRALEEERRLDAFLLKDVQDERGALRLWPFI
jgi:hypothetical protein